MFSDAQLEQFDRDGFVIVPGLAAPDIVEEMRAIARRDVAAEAGPLEYEADLGYPGAPPSRAAPGGRTVRRLLGAFERGAVFRDWALAPAVVGRVRQLLGPRILLPRAHHNCVMTKQPRFSSETHWHQDIRYWSFAHQALVSVWLALGRETPENGCLRLLPGTHRMAFDRARLDARQFLREDLPENRALIGSAVPAPLEPGDALFFHALAFHAAGRNTTGETKFSLVFTYRPEDNPPLPGTRSTATAEVVIP